MPSADLSQRFQEVLASYLEAKERGERVDPQALLRAHPELAADLKEFFANEKQFASAAGMTASAAAPIRTPVGQRVGDYELLAEIARGGMGVVYRARHVALQRLVALKMMLGGEFAGREGLRRFNDEAKVVAELDHSNIVPIYEVGAHDGQAFYAMKLIDGPSLKDEIAWYAGKPEQAARLIIQVARAVHHAHQRGVLHRDLKPGNILLQTAREEKKPVAKKGKEYPVSGVPQSAIGNLQFAIPYVTDFGLAKRFRADGQASQSTAVVGTAAYMAPEQATGKEALTVAADVYSLGAILYELLTGTKPFTGDNPMEVLLKVVNDEPVSPRDARPGLDADLAQICLKCLRKQPQERYASAEALAVELVQWLEGETLTVRAPTLPERSWRWCRRHPIATGLIGMIVLAVAGSIALNAHLEYLNHELIAAKLRSDQDEKKIAAGALELAEQERLARIDAEKAMAEIKEISAEERAASEAKRVANEAKEKAHAAQLLALKESQRLLVQHYIGNGQQILQRGDVFGSAIWFAKALEHEPDETLHRIRLGTVLRQCPPLEQMWFFDSKIRLLRLSPSGDRLLIGAKAGEAALWDAQTGKQLGAPMRHEGGIAAAEFSPDGQWLVTAGADKIARLWNAATGMPHGNPLSHTQSIHSVAFSSDSSKVATGSADKSARVWSVATTKQAANFEHAQEVRLTAFHPDGKKLLTVCENPKVARGELHVWDLTNQKPYFEPWPDKNKKDKKDKAEVKGILAAGFSRDGRRLYAVTSGHKIFLWDAAGKPIQSGSSLSVKGDAGNWFSPALDKFVLSAETDAKLIDLPGGGVAHTLRHDSPIDLAQFSPGGRFVATTSANGGVRLWRADTGTPFCPPLPHGVKVALVGFSHNDQRLATVSDDHVVRLWNLAWADRDKIVALAKNKGTLLSGSPDGRHALLAQAKSTVIWDIDQGRAVGALLPLAAGTPLLTRWAADGTSIAIATAGEVRLWEVPSGKALTPTKELAVWDKKMLEKKGNKTTHLLDCDGQRLAVWKTKGTLEIQDVSGQMAKTLKLALVPDVFRFSPDRRCGAAGFADGSLRLWDLAEGKPATPPFWHGEPIRQIAYSEDGRLLASAGPSGRIRVWDTGTGQALSGDLFAGGPLVDLAFRADAGMLHAWTEGRVQRWSLQPQSGSAADLLLRTRRAAGQDINADSGVLVPLDAAALKVLWQGP
jgi:serine/threonine protein kinase/WD40 repeat protein